MTKAKPAPLTRLARWWWLLVSAMWIVGFAFVLKWSPAEEVVYRQPIEQVALPDASAQTIVADPQMPYLAGDQDGAPDQRRAEVRAQMIGDNHLGAERPDCWSDIYSAPNANGTEMQWRCETRSSWARMIVTNLLVLASFPFLLPLGIMGALRIVRRATRGNGA
jgi:hypothetical protein